MESSSAHIVCAVTNDLVTDQRMHKICQSLTQSGYTVSLIGRKLPGSKPLQEKPFNQHRLSLQYQKGPRFYFEYNQQLYEYLKNESIDLLWSVDLDTLWAMGRVAKQKDIPLIFDAHEYFTEVPELAGKHWRKRFWTFLGRQYITKADWRCTVSSSLAEILAEKYQAPFDVVRNVPVHFPSSKREGTSRKLIYQGVLNEGRCIELYIDAMERLPPDISLHLYGSGDVEQQLKDLAANSPAHDRIHFYGAIFPVELKQETTNAWLGLNLLNTSDSLSYHYSLANKFFDYMHAGIPSLNSDLPEYRKLLEEDPCGICLSDHSLESYVETVQSIYDNNDLYQSMVAHAIEAKQKHNWKQEEKILLEAVSKLTSKK